MAVAPSKKKSSAYEAGVREGAAIAKKKAKGAQVEIEIEQEEEEQESTPPEPEKEEMDSSAARRQGSRKRSAKGTSNTKAPMDGAGCGCGGKKGATCDGNCGGMRKRSDALTAPEYLAACELGIQDRSRSYIRARLDSAQRLDLKCGKGAISRGEKCHKGVAMKTETGLTNTGQVKSGWQVRKQNWGERFGDDLKNNFAHTTKTSSKTGAVVGGVTGLLGGGIIGGAVGAAAGSVVGGAIGAAASPLGAAISATVGPPTAVLERKRSKRRRDSVYAPGFAVDYDQLAV